MAITANAVRVVITTPLDDAAITALIANAVIITQKCAVNWTPEQTDAINVWVTAHLIASSQTPGLLSDKLGDAAQSFQRATVGDLLKGTSYGQQALLLDDTGCLARRGMQSTKMQVL